MRSGNETSKSLARAIAISAIVGDYDVNTGNMLVIQPEGQAEPTIGRIDFGHAFNDLLNAPKKMGGEVRERKHPIFDFFNRTNVASFPKGSISKVWRDYVGLVPSSLLADALYQIGQQLSLIHIYEPTRQ